jgi:hypothetical protein
MFIRDHFKINQMLNGKIKKKFIKSINKIKKKSIKNQPYVEW